MKHRAILALSIVALLCILLLDTVERRQLKGQVEDLHRELARERNLARGESSPLSSTDSKSVSEQTRQTTPRPDPLPSQSQGSDWKAARFNQAVIDVETRYGRFFARLRNWPTDRREALKRLMAENELRLLQTAQAVDASSPEEIQKALEAIERARLENTRRLEEAMGPADYREFDRSERERASAESVDAITNGMRANGSEISGDLEESILTAYAAALHDAAVQASRTDSRSLNPSQQTELNQQQQRAFQLLLLQRMSGVLNGKQLDAFMAAALERQGTHP